MLARAKKKYEETQRRLKKCSKDVLKVAPGVPVPFSSPRSQAVIANANNLAVDHAKATNVVKDEVTAAVIKNLSELKLQNKEPVRENITQEKVEICRKEEEWDSGSSCETISSSDSESGTDESEDRNTVIMEEGGSNRSLNKNKDGGACDSGNISLEGKQVFKGNGINGDIVGSNNIWRSATGLFTIHSFGSDDKPIMSEEWVSFILKTMKVTQLF